MSSFDIIFALPYPFSDHPSFPEGILPKALEVEGFRVGILETTFRQEKVSFVSLFNSINKKLKRKIELAPYLIVGHPEEKRADVTEMKKKLNFLGMKSTDVRIFTPTPGTLSTAMYYAECDLSLRSIPVEKAVDELMERKKLLASRKQGRL